MLYFDDQDSLISCVFGPYMGFTWAFGCPLGYV